MSDVATIILLSFFGFLLLLVLAGMTYSYATRRKNDFYYDIDYSSSEYMFGEYICTVLAAKGYIVTKSVLINDCIVATVREESKMYHLIAVVKCEYILDSDIGDEVLSIIETERAADDYEDRVMLCTNSYYHGENDYEVIIDRRNLWKECKKLH